MQTSREIRKEKDKNDYFNLLQWLKVEKTKS